MSDKYQSKIYYAKSINRSYFKEIKNIIAKYFKKESPNEILDFGCANGSLLFYLRKFFPMSNFTGVDIFKDALNVAKKRAKNSKEFSFVKNDLLKFKSRKKFDIIIASGVLGFFDDFRPALSKMIKLLNKKKTSKILLFGDFNSSGIDKIIKYRNNNIDSKWRKGFTTYSIKTISDYLRNKKLKLDFKKFNLPIDIKKNKDPMRSFTIKTKENEKFILNRAYLIWEFHSLIISKKK